MKLHLISPGNHEGMLSIVLYHRYTYTHLADCTEIPLTSFLCPPGQANFTDFMNRFVMPTATDSTSKDSAAAAARKQAAALAVPPFWFSFDYGTSFYKAVPHIVQEVTFASRHGSFRHV